MFEPYRVAEGFDYPSLVFPAKPLVIERWLSFEVPCFWGRDSCAKKMPTDRGIRGRESRECVAIRFVRLWFWGRADVPLVVPELETQSVPTGNEGLGLIDIRHFHPCCCTGRRKNNREESHPKKAPELRCLYQRPRRCKPAAAADLGGMQWPETDRCRQFRDRRSVRRRWRRSGYAET